MNPNTMNPNTKMLLGALVAAGLAIAGYYGLVTPQQATSLQNQANQTLGTTPQQTMGGSTAPLPAQPAPMSQASTAPQPAPAPH